MWNYINENEMYELYHHGILGQKWGIRRYQNKDGSLTPEGKKRAYKKIDKLEKKYGKNTDRGIRNGYAYEKTFSRFDRSMSRSQKKEYKTSLKLMEKGEREVHRVIRRFYSNKLKNDVDAGQLTKIKDSRYLAGYELYKQFVSDNYNTNFRSDINGNVSVSLIPKNKKGVR